MKQANEGSPTEVETHNAEAHADTAAGTGNEAADSQDTSALTGEDRLRAILRGEITEDDGKSDNARSTASKDAEDIAKMFDPDTGEFLEHEPEAEGSADTASTDRTGEGEEKDDDDHDGDAGDDDDDENDEEEDKTPPDGNDEKTGKDPAEKKRISIKRGRLSDRDFAIVQLADREHIGLEEAAKRLFGEEAASLPGKGKENDETAERENAEPEVTPDTLQTQIDVLLGERKKATQALDVEKATELSDQIHELKLQQRELKQGLAARQQTEAQALQTGVVASVSQAVAMFPDAGKEGSELFQAIDAERLARQKTDPAFFRKPNWPKLLAIEVATDMGIAPVPRKQANGEPPAKKPAGTQAAVAPKKQARPAPPNPAPGNTTGATNTTEAALLKDLAAANAKRDPEAIKGVMRRMEEFEAANRKR